MGSVARTLSFGKANRHALICSPALNARGVGGGAQRHCSGSAIASPPPDPALPRQGHGPFDTYRFVQELETAGVPRQQAEAIMNQVLLAISEANTRQIALVATQQDLLNLKSETSEKVFSSTLRYDLAQRHLKELMQRDLMQVKADVRQEEKFDFAKLHDEITELEKRVFQRREADEMRFTQVNAEIAAVERRVITQNRSDAYIFSLPSKEHGPTMGTDVAKGAGPRSPSISWRYGIGFLGSILALGLGAARFLYSAGSK